MDKPLYDLGDLNWLTVWCEMEILIEEGNEIDINTTLQNRRKLQRYPRPGTEAILGGTGHYKANLVGRNLWGGT